MNYLRIDYISRTTSYAYCGIKTIGCMNALFLYCSTVQTHHPMFLSIIAIIRFIVMSNRVKCHIHRTA